jgi:hypothetical protein
MHQPGAAKELSAKAVEARRREREKARQDADELLSVPKDGAAIQDAIRECIGEVRAGKLDPEISRAEMFNLLNGVSSETGSLPQTRSTFFWE